MAADVGLVGVGLNGPGLPSAAALFSMAPPVGLIRSALSGSSAAAGLILGASAASQVVLPAVSFGGVVSGTLAIQTNATGGSHTGFAASLASALENEASGKPGEVSGSPPASSTETPVSDSSPAAPAPDSQRQGNYRPQWVLPPSKPMAPPGAPALAPSGPSADEEEAMDLGGDDQEARREIEELIKRLQAEGPLLGGVPYSFSRWIKGLYDRHERQSLTNDGYGPCVSWVLGINRALLDSQADGVYVKAEGVIWTIASLSPVAWGNHVGVRITVTIDGETRSFYMDNGWLGGEDHIFFVDDVPSHYSNELPLAPWE